MHYPYGTGRAYVPYPDPPYPAFATVNIRTRGGSPEWLRVGFVFPTIEEPLYDAHRQRVPVFEHEGRRKTCRKCGQRKEGKERKERPCQCRECERHREHEPLGDPCCPARRYPLFGRVVDFARSLWEYSVWDSVNGVRIPIGVPRNQNELHDGDVVFLVGEATPYRVSLNELDDYWNFPRY